MSDSSIASSISAGLQSALGRLGSSLKNRVAGMLPQRETPDDQTAPARKTSSPKKTDPATPATGEPLDGALVSEAKYEILAYIRENQTLFDRAERFESRAERLAEDDGSTSESARNKARRAQQEILAGLAALRESFVERNPGNPQEAGAAFDSESGTVFTPQDS